MKNFFLPILLLCFSLPAVYCQQQKYWQQQADCKIDVTLNDVEHTLDGYIKINYTNNSPDTLKYIWFHLWPNAYKNDKTAFSDQQLENGSTEFYFSNADKRGYINRLDFKQAGITCQLEDHPQHQDIVKIILPKPLFPKSSGNIETPFHVKLPYNFSRCGHINQSYQITQWYPKPAVYDRKGWHPIPYLDQGEFYSEFGNYEVQITLPKNYIVAATGVEQNKTDELTDLVVDKQALKKDKNKSNVIPSDVRTKTLLFKQENVHDFAWFASKEFAIKKDTLQLASGKIIDVYAYYYKKNEGNWKNSILFIKRAVSSKSKWLGEYPYNIVSVVDNAAADGGGMEYPTITVLNDGGNEKMLDYVINHEIGHNWFYGILASNERKHPWMDEGMNSYYDNKYSTEVYGNNELNIFNSKSKFVQKRLPADIQNTLLQTVIATKNDQPIETASEQYNNINYNSIAYTKTAHWLALLEKKLGSNLFDSCMKIYYNQWKFKHPYPEDFKKSIEATSGQNLDDVFALLSKKGELENTVNNKSTKFVSFFSLKETDKYNYIAVSPLVGVNFYDKLMIGGVLHNYTLPQNRFQFIVSPMYATNSKQLNGLGRISYKWYTPKNADKIEVGVAGSTFSADSFTDSVGNTRFLRFSKMAPFLRYTFSNKNARSNLTKFVQWKTFLFREQGLSFGYDSVLMQDIIAYPTNSRYLNQLLFNIENNRILYPYKGVFTAEQAADFVRLNFTGNYYFNYATGGGLNVRLFAGKFIYLTDKTFTKQFESDAYHLNMSGAKGYEDYTYSNYFVGRNEFEGLSSQQIMIRDGGFKVRTDYLSNKIGKTDDWLAAVNFTSSIPNKINPLSVLPFKLPIKAFLDIGTYADAWKKNAVTGKFVYDAGLQLSLLNNTINVYVPLLYSKVYSDYFKSTITEKRFMKNISFSIDIHNINLRKYFPQLPL
ncbi:MAG: M1 family metallopeptidase [Chitinophagaceae bacterium]|nr:M1 family metallopeptidase [Chitinophagaceae bacterium]